MKSALLHEHAGLRIFLIACESGDEAIAVLASFAASEQLGFSHFTGVGAFSGALVGFFEWPAKRYRRIAIDEQVEVLTVAGDITLDKMETHQIRRIPVVDGDGCCAGIIAQADLSAVGPPGKAAEVL